MPLLNILESDFRLPSKVCILAPGPRGRPHYAEIPDDYLVIALSKAVLIPQVQADIWMMHHTNQDWFDEANAVFDGVCIFKYEPARAVEDKLGEKACYCYDPLQGNDRMERRQGVDGRIRGGASVAGHALQIAYTFGVKDILLCGVDMSGNGYFDESINVRPEHGETWSFVSLLNPMIRWMIEEQGINITTLSPTKLDVPTYRPLDTILQPAPHDGLQEEV